MELEQEVSFNCPHCAEEISMLFESLYGGQSYTEDCQVCCGPIKVKYTTEDGQVAIISAEAE